MLFHFLINAKYGLFYLYLFPLNFHVIIFSISGWLIQGIYTNKKGHDRVSQFFKVSQATIAFFLSWEWSGEVAFWDCNTSTCSVTDDMLPSWTPTTAGPLEHFTCGARRMSSVNGAAGNGPCADCMHLLCSCSTVLSDSLTKPKCKITMLRIRDGDTRALHQAQSSSEHGKLCDYSTHPWGGSPAYNRPFVQMTPYDLHGFSLEPWTFQDMVLSQGKPGDENINTAFRLAPLSQ